MRRKLFQKITPPPIRRSKWWKRRAGEHETVHEGVFMLAIGGHVISFDSPQEAMEWARGKRK